MHFFYYSSCKWLLRSRNVYCFSHALQTNSNLSNHFIFQLIALIFAPVGYSFFCDIKFAQFMCMYVNRIQMCSSRLARQRFFLYWKPTRCTISHIYLIKYSTCFGRVHCPSSGVSQHCIHAIGICHASSVGVC